MELDYLATKYGTDKRTGGGNHGYTPIYEHYFSDIRFQVKSMLEVGVADGKSLNMWEDYFPNAQIYGVDQNGFNPTYPLKRNAQVFKLSQDSVAEMENTFKEKRLEIIVDDASHETDKTFTTFTTLFPILSDGGYYCIEDLWWDFSPMVGRWLVDHKDQFDWMNVHSNTAGSCTLIVVHKK